MSYASCRSAPSPPPRCSGLEWIGGHTIFTHALPPQPVVLDLGANHGVFARAMRKRFNALVWCLEPFAPLIPELEAIPHCRAFCLAIASKSGTATIHTGPNTEANSCFPLPGFTYTATSQVPAISLEDFLHQQHLQHVHVLKVDIEGSELDMFQTTPDDVLEKFDQISVEFHEWLGCGTRADVRSIIYRLRQIGFRHLSFVRGKYADVLFIHRRHLGPLRHIGIWSTLWFVRLCRFLTRKLLCPMSPSPSAQ